MTDAVIEVLAVLGVVGQLAGGALIVVGVLALVGVRGPLDATRGIV